MEGLANCARCFQPQFSDHLFLETFPKLPSLPQITVVLRTCHCRCLLTHLLPTPNQTISSRGQAPGVSC